MIPSDAHKESAPLSEGYHPCLDRLLKAFASRLAQHFALSRLRQFFAQDFLLMI
jgi:hypothetical protein